MIPLVCRRFGEMSHSWHHRTFFFIWFCFVSKPQSFNSTEHVYRMVLLLVEKTTPRTPTPKLCWPKIYHSHPWKRSGSSKHNMVDWCYYWLIILHIIGNYIRIYHQKDAWLTQMALDFSRWSLRTKKRTFRWEWNWLDLLVGGLFLLGKNPPQSFHMKITWKSAPWNLFQQHDFLGSRFQPLNLEWVFHQILK